MAPYQRLPTDLSAYHPRRHFRILLMLAITTTLLILLYPLLNFRRHQSRFFLLPSSSNWNDHDPGHYLIDTPTCRLRDYPLFDPEIVPLYQNNTGTEYDCDQQKPPFKVSRINFTWIKIDFPLKYNITGPINSSWICFGAEIYRHGADSWNSGPEVGPLGTLNNFAHNKTEAEAGEIPAVGRWDAARVTCRQHPNASIVYRRVVPLVQHYVPRRSREVKVNGNVSSSRNASEVPPNILLLGLDSISRLNFQRQMNRTRQFLERQGAIPLVGYHKVGENSYPNILPILTGRPGTDFYNGSEDRTFDEVPLIWKHFKAQGYLTTFIEDMPVYGLFYWRGGFRKQPTDYYLTPTNLAIWNELYYTHTCYQDVVENKIYLDYLIDALTAYRDRGAQPHFTMAHLSTLTHNYFNHAGYADILYHRFLSTLFDRKLHQNTVILFYSDHALRFGSILNTTAAVYEKNLPFVYLYIPEGLKLEGRTTSQLREILKENTHRLTSHYDLHATMLHVLYGRQPEDEQYGRSLLSEIPANRTCEQAGIGDAYCLCNSISPIPVTPGIKRISEAVIVHMNDLLARHGNYCVPLRLLYTYRAFESTNLRTGQSFRTVHFETGPPDNGTYEAMVEVAKITGSSQDLAVKTVKEISRTNAYGEQSSCVLGKMDIVQFCYCWKQKGKKEKGTKKGSG